MLDELVGTIERLQERIRDHRQSLGAYESRTRAALIDPLLTALGWDVSDPSLVEVEPKTKDGWADYALLGSSRAPVMFVEAKKLAGRDVSEHAPQAVNYAVGENLGRSPKIEHCAVTDGDEWRVYNVLTQDLVLTSAISAPDPVKTALQFLALWRENLVRGFAKAAEPIFVEGAPASPGATPPPSSPPESGWTPLTGDFQTTHGAAPSAIRLPDGGVANGKNWRSVIIEIALWLYRTGKLTDANCNVKMSTTRQREEGRYLLSRDGRHPSGRPFQSRVELPGTNIVLEGDLSAGEVVRRARSLLQNFGVDPATVFLRFP